MPDWTYQPLRPIAAAVIGQRRTQVLALRLLNTLITRTGGHRWIPIVFDHPAPIPQWEDRFGARVPPWIAFEAVRVLAVQGAGIVEINPVTAADCDVVRRAAAGRRCRVTAVTDSPEVAAAIAEAVDAATVGDPPAVVRLTTPDIAAATGALADPSATVLADPAVLIAAGPGWFNRVIEAGTPTTPPLPLREMPADPRRWPGWLWAALVGVGLIVAGLGAAAITLGPVLLWYDRNYLGASVSGLQHLNAHLVGFLKHDRITMAGNMIGIGILYLLLAQQMRLGHRWARRTLAISGAVAFGSYFYFLGTGGFIEPLHTLVVATLFPMLLLAVLRPSGLPAWALIVEGDESVRRRALWGQLLMIGVGGGLSVAGMVISAVGLTSVFVPTDLDFLGAHADHLRHADTHLLPFIAHDRAGFGGALVGAGLAILLISMWGWRPGQRWVWWCLLLGCAFGTVPVLIVHFAIGYTHFEHLAPVYVLVAATATSLTLSKGYLATAHGGPPPPPASADSSAVFVALPAPFAVVSDTSPGGDPGRSYLGGGDYNRWWQETGESELRQLLHWKWDPIGVSGVFPWAADEYDGYATRIAEALNHGALAAQIFDVLGSIESERMELSDSDAAAEARRTAAATITQWHQNSQERWRQFGARPR